MVKVSPVHRIGQRTFGVWGAHTSTLDWCEDNYVFTNYVAEAYNSFSNVPFFFLGLHGFVHTMSLTSGPTRQPHPHRYRYALCHLGISAIGIGSFIFHATLLWHAQVLLDELPMIWVASLILWTTLAAGPDDQSAGDSIGLRLGFVTLPVLITAAYLAYPDPVLHQAAYAMIQLCLNIRIYKLLQLLPRGSTPRVQSLSLLTKGTLTFLLGFIIWNIDNTFCEWLTMWRADVGELFGWISQGHAWWHILTGLGSHRIVIGITYLCTSIREPEAFEVAYALGFLPYIRQKVQTASVSVQGTWKVSSGGDIGLKKRT